MYSKNTSYWTKNRLNWTKNRSIAYALYNDATHLKINLNIEYGYRVLKIDATHLKINQGGSGYITCKSRVNSSKTRYTLFAALSSFKNIEPMLKGRYPMLWRYRAYAPSKQVGRRKKGLTNPT